VSSAVNPHPACADGNHIGRLHDHGSQNAGHGRPEGTLLGFCCYFPLACSDAAFECGDQTAVTELFGCTADGESRVSEASPYKSRPSGRLGVEAVNFSATPGWALSSQPYAFVRAESVLYLH
jgi:hypothetical protein